MGINITVTRDTVAEAVEDVLSLARAMGWSEAVPHSGQTQTVSALPLAPSVGEANLAAEASAAAEVQEKRRRRTKAEMDALRAAEAAQAAQPDSTSAQPVAQPKPDDTAELKRIAGNVAEVVPPPPASAEAPSAPADDGLDDVLAAEATYTRDDLRALLTEIKAGARGKEKVIAVLAKFGVTTFGALAEGSINAAYAFAKTQA